MNNPVDDQASNSEIDTMQSLSVGKTLREAREQLGLSVNDVANRIKFAPRQIEALEEDDFIRLPEAAFVRGFVRSYARLLELDPTHLISSLPSSHVQSSAMQDVKSVEIPLPSALSARRYNIIWLAAALVIAVALAIFERMHDRGPEVAVTVAKTNVQAIELPNSIIENASAPVVDQAQSLAPTPQATVNAIPAQIQAATAKQEVRITSTLTSTQAVLPKSVSNVPAQQTVPPLVQQERRVTPTIVATKKSVPASVEVSENSEASSPEHALRLEFEEDAWVEIKDGTEKILISRMHTAGSLVRVTGKSPMLVIIGNARAVRMFDNGKKVNLARYTSAEVARVKLK